MWFLTVDGAPLCTTPNWGIHGTSCAQRTVSEAILAAARINGRWPDRTIGAWSLDHCPTDLDINDMMAEFKTHVAPKINDLLALTEEQAVNFADIPLRVCPRCNTTYQFHPAISRADNETEICSLCGTDEALLQFGLLPSPMMNITPDWLTTVGIPAPIHRKEDHGQEGQEEEGG